MPSRHHEPCTRSLLFGVFTLALLGILPVAAQAQTATVTLEILNTPDASGDYVVSKGTDLEVGFTVVDPNNELVGQVSYLLREHNRPFVSHH